tara:strand:+ start:99 stop:1193 length:1095 start_codon:yes stop_codon:yes gene_type:complete
MAAPFGNQHSSAVYSTPPVAAIDADSSEEEEDQMTVDECIQDWYYTKSRATQFAYKNYVKHFTKWLKENYNRGIDHRLKTKHVKLYLVHRQTTMNQLRPVISVLKSLFKHMKKKNVLRRDILINFENVKQKPARHERTMDISTVKKMFKESLKKSSPVSHVLLQLLTYCGLRRTVLSKLLRSDIVRTELIKNGSTEFKYSVKARDAKGGKNRTIGVKDSVGKSLWDYAQSCKTEYLFCGKNGGHLSDGAVANRIKTLAKKIGRPEISCHWFRHFFATVSLHAGANLVDVSKALGHSSVQVTSIYLHSSDKPVSALIDLSTSMVDGETVDDSIIYVKTETSKKSRVKIKAPKKGKKRKTNNGISL